MRSLLFFIYNLCSSFLQDCLNTMVSPDFVLVHFLVKREETDFKICTIQIAGEIIKGVATVHYISQLFQVEPQAV